MCAQTSAQRPDQLLFSPLTCTRAHQVHSYLRQTDPAPVALYTHPWSPALTDQSSLGLCAGSSMVSGVVMMAGCSCARRMETGCRCAPARTSRTHGCALHGMCLQVHAQQRGSNSRRGHVQRQALASQSLHQGLLPLLRTLSTLLSKPLSGAAYSVRTRTYSIQIAH